MNQDIRNTLAWIVFATFITGTAVWQGQVAAEREVKARRQSLPPPPKTRHAVRPVSLSFAGDPVADYIARCEKGLTDLEISWIVEDFTTAGLERGIRVATKDEYLAQRQTQHRWYHDALVDGLRLSSEQSAQMTAKLAGLLDLAKANFVEALNAGPLPIEQNGHWYAITGTEPIHQLISANRWLPDDKATFMPWNLCTLSPEQEKLTWKRSFDALGNTTTAPLQQGDPEFLLSMPASFNEIDPPAKILSADTVFPLLRQQEFKNPPADPATESENNPLSRIRQLHPSQLKILLLLHPEMAAEIQHGLDAAH